MKSYTSKRVWGPILWNVLHNIPIIIASINHVENVLIFLENYYNIVPCHECQTKTKKYLDENPIILKDKNDLFQCKKDLSLYIFNFHYTNKDSLSSSSYTKFLSTPLPTIDYDELKKVLMKNKKCYGNLPESGQNYVSNFIDTLKSFYTIS